MRIVQCHFTENFKATVSSNLNLLIILYSIGLNSSLEVSAFFPSLVILIVMVICF